MGFTYNVGDTFTAPASCAWETCGLPAPPGSSAETRVNAVITAQTKAGNEWLRDVEWGAPVNQTARGLNFRSKVTKGKFRDHARGADERQRRNAALEAKACSLIGCTKKVFLLHAPSHPSSPLHSGVREGE